MAMANVEKDDGDGNCDDDKHLNLYSTHNARTTFE